MWGRLTPTLDLRWVVRGQERVLQQRFLIESGADGEMLPSWSEFEWRNIPEFLVPLEPLAPKT